MAAVTSAALRRFKVQGKRWWFKSFKPFNRFAPFKTFTIHECIPIVPNVSIRFVSVDLRVCSCRVFCFRVFGFLP
jgi:hypothetical protein